ncbi:GNAT family acetyltransferase, putative [Talaromyces stipitatus ATCC 10500]|uniref:GNAT family acetyltransferase, putative n=1 Tax=Talaromyces stipitatus (strain ATCC 10500 / CBS 375.48 / QM 6759 / NRRL 1006) TaxID=441959 RepID=B8MHT0_TALSN|nr:GNAT family acetyltransferase, putative [Talaromyces stipitatus ATCC 10500]EED16410.1 GNAT family acetyltransferase, putative [Talaromyces stipitatus ATCC 10500]
MPYKVEVAQDADMPELMEALWDAFEKPYQGVLRNFFPILNNDREASLLAATNGQREEYKSSYPELIWLKVTYREDDNQNSKGKIVGGAKWYFFQRNPFAPKPGSDHDPTAEEAVWYPEGPGRTFATAAMHALDKPRMTMGQGPHAFLNIAFTVFEHRRKGVSNLFLKWGLSRADELGLESWLDASTEGRPVYTKLGFVPYRMNNVNPAMPSSYTEEEKAEWEKLEKEILPMDSMTMWRPLGGKFVEGETVKPWDR